MRLIDAGNLNFEGQKYNKSQMKSILDFIDKQPTTYDVDKVVEQLEELKKYNLNLADCMLDIQSHGLNRHFVCLEDAIEIVKAGGRDER